MPKLSTRNCSLYVRPYLIYTKKFTSFCQVLKDMHSKEKCFLFSPSRCDNKLLQRAVVAAAHIVPCLPCGPRVGSNTWYLGPRECASQSRLVQPFFHGSLVLFTDRHTETTLHHDVCNNSPHSVLVVIVIIVSSCKLSFSHFEYVKSAAGVRQFAGKQTDDE